MTNSLGCTCEMIYILLFIRILYFKQLILVKIGFITYGIWHFKMKRSLQGLYLTMLYQLFVTCPQKDPPPSPNGFKTTAETQVAF